MRLQTTTTIPEGSGSGIRCMVASVRSRRAFADMSGYEETWSSDRCVLWAEGVIQQSAVFGEDLHLIRRIEADVGENAIRISDRVVNHGFSLTPHMYFYHFNVGFPVLDEGSRIVALIASVLWAAHAGADYEAQKGGYKTASG